MRIKRTIFFILVACLCIAMIMLYVTVKNRSQSETKSYTVIIKSADESNSTNSSSEDKSKNELKYILQWTSPKNVPFMYMGNGRQGFIDKNCPFTNCFVTADRKYFGEDITKFDVIAFSGPEVIRMDKSKLPEKRSPYQKYAFASIESSDYYPVCSNRFDGYFNWTWTFKLDSEVKWGYMVIRDRDNNVVGPRKDMNWIKFEDMDPINEEFKQQLNSKSKAAAWFVSNCNSRNRREVFVKDLQKELSKYDLTIDIYGKCGSLTCSRANEDECYKLVKDKYYFYLSFENSFSEDYVTEKLLNAVRNDAVPIVYGAANYSRFLPEKSYLNARELGVENLAANMNRIIKNLDEYYNYFRWKKYYSYHMKRESVDTDEYCLFCTTLNDVHLVKEQKVYQNFRQWWDPPHRC